MVAVASDSISVPTHPTHPEPVLRGDQQPIDDGDSMEFTDEDEPTAGESFPNLQYTGMINNHINYNKYNSIFYPPGSFVPAGLDDAELDEKFSSRANHQHHRRRMHESEQYRSMQHHRFSGPWQQQQQQRAGGYLITASHMGSSNSKHLQKYDLEYRTVKPPLNCVCDGSDVLVIS